ncbi:MAG TPA: FHA domain-containing protein [Ilumatobacteraceae bacterium]|nr:FHA domain-containing protein [Ilumatobacteraceae bacterium]
MTDVVCPNGHHSADPEWCDTCGARIGGAPAEAAAAEPPQPAAAPAAPASTARVDCPNCGLSNEAANLFCEQCGYDFTTGQAPPSASSSTPDEPSTIPDSTVKWVVVVEVDPAWFALKGELADQPCPPASSSTVALTQHTALVGRSSQSRGIHPEIALDSDTGVSRRHAQLVRDGDGLSVMDLSSTNGTYFVEAGSQPASETEPIEPGVPKQLHDGDRVYVGAWSRLTVRIG